MKEVENKGPAISVIVPIYNVSQYIRQCLDSLNNQSFQNIEVIMIDDGSPDDSGKIAEEYVRDKYPIFRIIHTENRGLSAARNLGISEAKGQWIMLVDSDDWVDRRFCERAYNAAIENDADMVLFGYRKTTDMNGEIVVSDEGTQSEIITNEKAYEIGETAPWNKLYKKELFDNIKYPVGHAFEDYAVTHQLVYAAKRIAWIKDRLYFYRIREGSICSSVVHDKDRLEMSIRRYDELVKLGYPEEKAWAQLVEIALKCYGRSDKEVRCEAAKVLDKVEKIPAELSKKTKGKMKLWLINKHLYRLVYKMILAKKYKQVNMLFS